MYPNRGRSGRERVKMEQRKTHKMLQDFPTGSLWELEERMRKEGFSYQHQAGQPSYFETGIAKYLGTSGEKALLRRVEKGKPAMWTGAKVGLIRTAQQPDLWQLIRKARKKK